MPSGLNPAQREAVETLSGPLLVLAGAGTGKTRVVTYRIANLIRHGTLPDRILAVTFTRKAAGEMQERASELIGKRGKKGAPKPEISTFHSLCVRVLRRHASQLGYPNRFSIADRSDQESVARAALREIRAPNEALRPGDLLGFISRWKMRSMHPSEAASTAETDLEHLAAVAYRRYQANLKNMGVVDFDDLLLLTEELFRKFPAVRREEAQRFDHVLIDEYQDTNNSQYEIVRGLAMGRRNLCVVGDDDQSIYAWRGAEVAHILRFHKDWPDAKVVRLEENYRSTEAIISYANTLIEFNAERHDKTLRATTRGGERPRILQMADETEEAKQIVGDIKRKLQAGGWRDPSAPTPENGWERRLAPGATALSPRDVAILFRTNEQPRAFEAELRAAKLPYVLIGGMSFYDRREVRDLIAYLKLIPHPDDEPALLRILNTPPRGIGDGARKALVDAAVARGAPLWRVLPEAASLPGVSATAARGAEDLVQKVARWRAAEKELQLPELIERVISDSRYRDELLRLYPDASEREGRSNSLNEIVNAAAAFESGSRPGTHRRKSKDRSLRDFLDELSVGDRDDPNEKKSQLGRDAIALMTLHSAKGLEFPQVYLVGLEEGILPHKRSLETGDASIDEERRLAYVGVTRAREKLTMSFALTRRKWGKPRDTVPSRYLFEMTGQAESGIRLRQEAAKKAASNARRGRVKR